MTFRGAHTPEVNLVVVVNTDDHTFVCRQARSNDCVDILRFPSVGSLRQTATSVDKNTFIDLVNSFFALNVVDFLNGAP